MKKVENKFSKPRLLVTMESKVNGDLYTIPIEKVEQFQKDEMERSQNMKETETNYQKSLEKPPRSITLDSNKTWVTVQGLNGEIRTIPLNQIKEFQKEQEELLKNTKSEEPTPKK